MRERQGGVGELCNVVTGAENENSNLVIITTTCKHQLKCALESILEFGMFRDLPIEYCLGTTKVLWELTVLNFAIGGS